MFLTVFAENLEKTNVFCDFLRGVICVRVSGCKSRSPVIFLLRMSGGHLRQGFGMQIPVSNHFSSSDVWRRGGARRSEEERGAERGGDGGGRGGGVAKKQDLHRGGEEKLFFSILNVWCCRLVV